MDWNSPDRVLTRLAHDNTAHLRWLGYKFGGSFNEEDRADILQDAFARATKSLTTPGTAPQLPDWEHAVAWFRTVCSHTAIDAKRARDGRRESERAARPTFVPLEVTDGGGGDRERPQLAIADAAMDAVVADSDLGDHQEAILTALRQLPDEHARIIRWRYLDHLPPRAVMRLERLASVKQYEGRHRRAIKALGGALAALNLAAGCGQARLIIRHQPQALLSPAAVEVRLHVESCLACTAFGHQLRGAFAMLPLTPFVLGSNLSFGWSASTGSPGPAPVPPPPIESVGGGLWHGALAHPKLLAMAAAVTVATGGGVAAAHPGDEHRAAPPVTTIGEGAILQMGPPAPRHPQQLRHDPQTRITARRPPRPHQTHQSRRGAARQR